VGSDGLIRLNLDDQGDFEMDFFNPDGSQSFCGNGARCSVLFAKDLGISFVGHRFKAIDGYHEFAFLEGKIGIHMNDVNAITPLATNQAFLDTGSPHVVLLNDDLSSETTLAIGRSIRYADPYVAQGVNVNLIRIEAPNHIAISTYERGVEQETLACGTGATACALYVADRHGIEQGSINVHAKGGDLAVRFERHEGAFNNVWLIGPATQVFTGEMRV
jgi:diaminopimelate epimerase